MVDVVAMAYAAIVLIGLTSLAVIAAAATAVVLIIRNGFHHLSLADKTFPTAMSGILYADIPIAAVAVLAELRHVPQVEVVEAYQKDSMERRAIVEAMFKKDAVIARFMTGPSTFMQSGYSGEAKLLERTTTTTTSSEPACDAPDAT